MDDSSILDIRADEISLKTIDTVQMPEVKFENKKIKKTNTTKTEQNEVEPTKNAYASKKSVAEGMMDIALLTANANQLRFLLTYNSASQTYYVSVSLIIISLVLQVSTGIALIFKVCNFNKF